MSSVKLVSVKALLEVNFDGEPRAEQDREFMFLRRKKALHGETEPGYDIPGGKLETNLESKIIENPIKGLERELFQECGLFLDFNFIEPIGFQKFTIEEAKLDVERTYFLARYMLGQEVRLSPQEHTEKLSSTLGFALENVPLNPMLREFLVAYSGGVGGVPTRSQITL